MVYPNKIKVFLYQIFVVVMNLLVFNLIFLIHIRFKNWNNKTQIHKIFLQELSYLVICVRWMWVLEHSRPVLGGSQLKDNALFLLLLFLVFYLVTVADWPRESKTQLSSVMMLTPPGDWLTDCCYPPLLTPPCWLEITNSQN